MNLLITGATGFIGKNLIKSLEQKYNIFLLIRETTDLTFVSNYNFFCFKDNIDELSNYIKKNNITGVVHLASLYVAQHKSDQVKDLILSNVYLGTAIIEASVQAGVDWFINTGTFWQNYIHNKEQYCPVNLYAASKQAFADMAKFYTESYPIKFVTLKLCDTYGPNDTRRKFLTLFNEISITGESLDMSEGKQKIDILHIDDVIEGFKILIELIKKRNLKNLNNEYVLTSSKKYTLKEISLLFTNITGRNLNINWGKRVYRDREVMIPWEKGEILPHWKDRISLEEGIKEYLNK